MKQQIRKNMSTKDENESTERRTGREMRGGIGGGERGGVGVEGGSGEDLAPSLWGDGKLFRWTQDF